MKIELDIKPFSINNAWAGRRYKTPEYKEWREEMLWLLKKIKPFKKADFYTIEIDWWSPHFSLADFDNPVKCITDALVEAKIITDDRYIKRGIVEKHKGKHKILIKIKEYEPKKT